MVKRNYWFKFKEDFFKQAYIKKLRKIAGGDTYIIIYQEILLMSVNTGGKIEFEGIESTLEEELALILDEDADNVKITLEFMKALKLIVETDEKNVFLLPSMLSLIGSEGQSAKRVRDHRDRKKALHCNTDVTKCNTDVTKCNTDVTKCNTDVTKCKENVTPDIDLNINKNIFKEKEKEKENPIVELALDPAVKIIEYLNKALNTKYRMSKATTTLIKARIKERFTVDDFKTVIDNKYQEWGNDSDMSKYLRPVTLFGTKFESYLNQLSTAPKEKPKSFDQMIFENNQAGYQRTIEKIKNKKHKFDHEMFKNTINLN